MRPTQPGSAPTAESAPFATAEWSLLAIISIIWGSAFLWTVIALEHLSAEAVAFLRLALGAAALAVFPSARRRIARVDWPKLLIVAFAGNAGPALLFAIALKTVDSAVAGMAVSATPLASLLVWIFLYRRLPAGIQLLGLAIGFAGVALMAAPNLIGVDAAPAGIAMLALATLGYGVTQNVIGSLQRKYGSVSVIFWALLVGSAGLLPLGVTGSPGSQVSAASILAIVFPGVIATGVARSFAAALAGRVGAVRGSIHTYFIPVLAVMFGVTLHGEQLTPVELAGLPVALAGGYLVTRRNALELRRVRRLPDSLARGGVRVARQIYKRRFMS